MHALIPLFEDHTHPMVNQMMSDALRCPKCGAAKESLIAMSEASSKSPRYLVACRKCGFMGPFGRGLGDAVRRWNKPISFLARIFKKTRHK